ncbi:cytochrome c oxidase subunit 3 [Poriferisphaera sp. WC338]|uniref:cytochrome c oxidase subunit 3 n=1 Tax=Poriferisphaera sp. WC338 TaxID=3425129 RepID=UPI003D8196F9
MPDKQNLTGNQQRDIRRKPVPLRTGIFGMRIFLISVGMLFVASMIGYLIFDYQIRQPYEIVTTTAEGSPQKETVNPDIPNIHMPLLLWLSSFILIASTLTMQAALKHVQYQRLPQFKRMINITLFLAIAFILVQTPAMIELLDQHYNSLAAAATPDIPWTGRQLALFGFIVFLIALHAAHVIGGLIPLAVVRKEAYLDRYDHEHYGPIKYLTMYWHFLDAVWIVMFLTLLVSA